MKKWMVFIFVLTSFLLLTGCWNKTELDEDGFVMAIALDQGKGGRLELTTQMYRPNAGKGGMGER